MGEVLNLDCCFCGQGILLFIEDDDDDDDDDVCVLLLFWVVGVCRREDAHKAEN